MPSKPVGSGPVPSTELVPGQCACYVGRLCYADCTCSYCAPHRFRGIILGGKRYFQAMDLQPGHPIRERADPEDLVARE